MNLLDAAARPGVPARLVFATFNRGKLREGAAILAGLPFEVIGPAEAGLAALPEETGDTFLENAILKAAGCLRDTGLPTLADDSGLEVAALGGAPGVHSARFAGPEADPIANIRLLLERMQGVEDRRARFVCTAVLALPGAGAPASLPEGVARLDPHPAFPPGTLVLVATGEVRGTLLHAPRGEGGFGYDPIFRHDEGTFAEIPDDRKNALSHRGQAFGRLRAVLAGG